jgi:hypothetical protein
VARAREQLRYVRGIELDFVTDLTLAGFKETASCLTPDTILLVLSMFGDAEGRRFVPRDANAAIAAVASVPTYAVYSSMIGVGVLGGYVETFDSIGRSMAELALQVISGAADVPAIVMATDRSGRAALCLAPHYR